MAAPSFASVVSQYTLLWARMQLLPARAAEFTATAARLHANIPRYQAVSAATGVPVAIIAVIHEREASGSFNTNLANGDPLTARTVHVPAGRPVSGNPPFTWEYAAEDALRYQGLDKIVDWTLERGLYLLEAYNGWGYFNLAIRSPYLWGGTNLQQPGKFVADGKFDPTVTDEQLGCAGMLAALFALDPSLRLPPVAPEPWATPGWQLFKDPRLAWVQSRLNQLYSGSPTLVVDGLAGPNTAIAVRAFQRDHGLTVDGIVGPATTDALKAALAAKSGAGT